MAKRETLEQLEARGLVMTTERVIAFAREAFRDHVKELLDDPSWIQYEAASYIAERRQIGSDLDMDFDSVCADVGSDYEIKRLRDLEKVTKAREIVEQRKLGT